MKICIAGASGYLGRHLLAAFAAEGHQVTALLRPSASRQGLPEGIAIRTVEATRPETLNGVFAGQDMVISALGLTRQSDRLRYRDVDYQANLNLLQAALSCKVPAFGYVHALTRGQPQSELLRAKAAFVAELQAAEINSYVFRPSGFFVDMEAVLEMARGGRVWALGDGTVRLNPIHGADLAAAIVAAVARNERDVEIGGPEVLSLDQVTGLAFAALGQPVRITHLPRWLAQVLLRLLKPLSPRHIWGPLEFFLDASGQDAVAPCHGTRRLESHFRALVASG